MKYNDAEIFNLIQDEVQRQQTTLNLIASENYASPEVLEASASVFANKYAEGYPGKRYYSGCFFADRVETIAQKRCKELFGAEHVNVQPHAGSPANLAVYFSVLKPGDTLMGMSLAEGGHLTHGHSVNFSGTIYKSLSYSVDAQTEQLDYKYIEKLALEYKPKLMVAGASAYSRVIDFERLAYIAHKAGSLFMADIAHIAGLVAAKLHPNPVPYADFVTSTTHKTLRGPRGGLIMCKKQYSELIDKSIMPGTQGGPFINSIAAKAVAFHEALQPEFKEYQQQVIKNAQTMVQLFKDRGYRIVADGTDNHLFILDLRNKNISGRQAELALENAGITVSRSCIPFDPAKPWVTSGIRLGTPAITTRGMKEQEMSFIVGYIDNVLSNPSEENFEKIKCEVMQLCSKFTLPY